MIKFQLNTVCKHIQHVTLYFLIKRCCDFCFVTARNSCVLTYYPYALKITVFILWCFNVFCYGNRPGAKCDVQCPYGYVLVGDSQIQCGDDGEFETIHTIPSQPIHISNVGSKCSTKFVLQTVWLCIIMGTGQPI